MPVATYETMFLLDSNKVSADAEGTKTQIHTILERHGGTVVISRPWDYNHKLAYPISKQKKGAFHIIYYTLESTKQSELERDFALQEGLILRQLTLKVDPKWNEIVLGVAREDTGNGFAVRGMKDEATVTTDPGAIGGDMMGGMGLDDIPSLNGGGGGGGREGGGGRGRGRRGEMSEKPD
ncbi:MAG: 30S ribosomal protein S6 [Planctomycetaceae bacterium]|nr:30S ribosomal protein S6 [Planctomycetaceae bacterium]